MKPSEYEYNSNPFNIPMRELPKITQEELEGWSKGRNVNRAGDRANKGMDKPRKTGSEMFRELLDHPERKSCGCKVCEEMLRVEKMPKKYPIRGWLQGLVEGSATLDEVEEVINKFLKEAKDLGRGEGREDMK